jgi:arginyl-tRNA synthetase
MFQAEQQCIETRIREYCLAQGIPYSSLEWKPIPFKGEWGMSTSFFALAAADVRATPTRQMAVPQRAQQIAEGVRETLLAWLRREPDQALAISHIEAVRGYLNIYFSTAEYARRVVDEVLARKTDFGRSPRGASHD